MPHPRVAMASCVLLGLAFSLPVRAQSHPPAPVVSFEAAAVVADGLPPDGEAVFFSVAREPQGYHQRVVSRDGVEVANAEGRARFDLAGQEVPLKSLWVVVDVASGGYSVAAPPGASVRELPFPHRGFEVGAPGLVNRLRHERESVHMLVARAGTGAGAGVWGLRTWDTAPTDRDGADDDQVLTGLSDFEPLGVAGAAAPPERFGKGDVLVVIDPRELAFYATRLVGPPVTGGSAP